MRRFTLNRDRKLERSTASERAYPRERVKLEAQGHLLKLKIPRGRVQGVGGSRGEISEFSADSRKRMLEKLARIDTAKCGFICLLTLTYPDRSGPPVAEESERDRATFLKRIGRAYPEASAIWRREWKPRESGAFLGVPFPHYHFLFFKLPFVECETVNRTWAEVLRHEGYLRTEIRAVQSWRQALGYVAKYMAKVREETERAARGDPAGVDAQRATETAPASSLVHDAYLTAEIEKPLIGRSWGLFNRKRLPLGRHWTFKLPPGDWMESARSDAREVWPHVNDDPDSGFSLFMEDPYGFASAVRQKQLASVGQIREGGE